MKLTRFFSLSFIPASHEDPSDPGVLKKVLFKSGDIAPGTVQMVNWAKLLPGKSFRPHFHDNMDEVFVIVSGSVEMTVGSETIVLEKGDAVLAPEKIVHIMRNKSSEPVEYIVFGVSHGEGGSTRLADSK